MTDQARIQAVYDQALADGILEERLVAAPDDGVTDARIDVIEGAVLVQTVK